MIKVRKSCSVIVLNNDLSVSEYQITFPLPKGILDIHLNATRYKGCYVATKKHVTRRGPNKEVTKFREVKTLIYTTKSHADYLSVLYETMVNVREWKKNRLIREMNGLNHTLTMHNNCPPVRQPGEDEDLPF